MAGYRKINLNADTIPMPNVMTVREKITGGRIFNPKTIKTKVLDNQSQFMNSPCGDPNKELNHKEENQK